MNYSIDKQQYKGMLRLHSLSTQKSENVEDDGNFAQIKIAGLQPRACRESLLTGTGYSF